MKYSLSAVLLLFLLSNIASSNRCPQLCVTSCFATGVPVACASCYVNFLAFSPIVNTTTGNCNCPINMFMNSGELCEPCPIECVTCTNSTYCTSCIAGYNISNSYSCVVQVNYDTHWVSKKVSLGFVGPSNMGESPLVIRKNGTLINITEADLFSHTSSCVGFPASPNWLGGYQHFDYTTVIYKTLYSLPPHQWINIRFKALIIDAFNNALLLELNTQKNYEPNTLSQPQLIWAGGFNSSERIVDFCGNTSHSENIAVVDTWLAHNSSFVKMQIRLNQSELAFIPNNPIFRAFIALKDLLIHVGSCGRNCEFCTSPHNCTRCLSPYVEVNGKCVCNSSLGVGFPTHTGCERNCVSGQFFSSTAKSCVDCYEEFPHCNTCDSNACITCNVGFFIYTDSNGKNWCWKQCPSGTSENIGVMAVSGNMTIHRAQCVACPMNCKTCNLDICLFCYHGYQYINGICVDVCPAAHYSSQGVCKQCPTNCLNCTNSGCQLCKDGLFAPLSQGVCGPICANSTTSSTCNFTCHSNCASCYGPNSNQCLTCIAGMMISQEGTCYTTCPPDHFPSSNQICQKCPNNCQTCNSSSCLSCSPGYFYDSSDLNCHRFCPSSFYPSVNLTTNTSQCKQCATGCSRCVNSTFCLSCQHDFELFNLTCLTHEQDYYEWADGDYRRCPVKCLQCRHKICTRCQMGWILNQGECVTQCPSSKVRKTINIYKHQHVNGTGAYQYDVCEWRDPLCQLPATDGSGNCLLCAFTYPAAVGVYNYEDRQTQCSFYCPKYYTKLDNLQCVACPQNCRRCLSNMTCLKCLDNYVINHINLLTSANLMNQSCLYHYCPNGYYSDSLQCQLCSVGCDVCLLDGHCFLCQSGYVLDSYTKMCKNSNCTDGNFLDTNINSNTTQTCLPCNANCTTCMGTSSLCTSCSIIVIRQQITISGVTFPGIYANGFLFQYTCVTNCPLGTFSHNTSNTCRKCDPRCLQCTSFRNCTTCQHNFYILPFYDHKNVPCVPECPTSFWADGNNTCLRCDAHCKSCYGSNEYQCLECYPNFGLDEGKCVYRCSDMKYLDKKSDHCEWCHPTCVECWGPTKYQCLTCKIGYYKHHRQCFQNVCPGATFLAHQEKRQCESCQFGCQYCSSSQFCHFCTPGYHFYEGWCYLTCPGNMVPVYRRYYKQLLGSICKPCNDEYSRKCQICDGGSCKRCQYGYYLWRGSTQEIQSLSSMGNQYAYVIEQCVSQCPSRTYLRGDNSRECVSCAPNCKKCTFYSYCTQCDSGFNLLNGFCTNACPSGKYKSSNSGYCYSCASNCRTCIDDTNCTSCYSTSYLHNSTTLQMVSCVSSCPTTYFSDPSGKCLKCPSTCVSCHNYTSCTQCISGHSISSGLCVNPNNNTCVANCGSCNGGVCEQCHYPYVLRIDPHTGVSDCVVNCSERTYDTAFRCQQCNATCGGCNNTANNCTYCEPGLYKHQHSCLPICPLGTSPNTTTMSCSPCPLNCINCHAQNCSICATGYYLIKDSQCVKYCPNSTFASVTDQRCFNCSQNCTSCIDIQNCTSCLNGFFLFNHSCVSKCPQTTYLIQSTTGQLCKSCKAPCYTCQDSTSCLSCIGGYIINGTICQTTCGLGYYQQTQEVQYYHESTTQNFTMYSQCQPCASECLTCSNSSEHCLSCPDGLLLASGQCVLKCPDATYNSSGICASCPPSCLQCHSDSTCLACISGAVLHNNICMHKCPQGYFAGLDANTTLIYTCSPCSLSCATCNGDSLYDCQTCSQGYYFSNGMCVSNCPSGSFSFNLTSTCWPCPLGCTLCTSISNCSSCQSNYILSNTNQCITNSTNDTNCSLSYCRTCSYASMTTTTTMCQECIEGYSLSGGFCVTECPASNYSLHGVCVDCSVNCVNCKVTGCNVCQNSYYLHEGQCYLNCPNGTINQNNSGICQPDPCLYYNTTYFPYSCLSCASPYLLIPNALLSTTGATIYNYICSLTCPNGTVRSNSQCISCPFNCLQCVSSSSCTKCNNYTTLYQGRCKYQCPVGTYSSNCPTTNGSVCHTCDIPFCLQCSNSHECTLCDEEMGAALSHGECYINCPSGTYRDSHHSNCRNCSQGCMQCTNQTHCTACQTNSTYLLLMGYCISTCPNGTYLSASTCLSCSNGCFRCTSAHVCTLCQSDYNIIATPTGYQCVQNCPSGHFQIAETSTILTDSNAYSCLPCTSPCLTCSSSTTCSACINGFTLSGQTCSTTCQMGYYPYIQILADYYGYTFQILICVPCSPICKTCTSYSTCTSCHLGSILDPYGNCVNSCPYNNQYYDSTTRECHNCSSTCYSCDGAQSSNCLACTPPLQLHQGACINSCPFGTYATTTYICQPCSQNCADCQQSQSNCTVCKVGALLQNTTTGSVCSYTCGSGYFKNTTTAVCQSCHSSCLKCSGASAYQCTSCVATTLLWQGQCITSCPSGSMHVVTATSSSCQTCPTDCLECNYTTSSGPTCTLCASARYLFNGVCVVSCPSGTYTSLTSFQCIACGLSGCQSCTFNSSFLVECTSCQSGYLMMQDSKVCLTTCPSGYQQTGTTCIANQICTQYLHNGYCMPACPSGTYATLTTTTTNSANSCLNCSNNCLSCSSLTTCNQCTNQTVSYSTSTTSECLSNCPSGHYNLNGVCEPCPTSCLACYLSSSVVKCTSCLSTYYLVSGTCLTTCSSGFFAVPSSNPLMCRQCSSNCAECLDTATNCTLCKNSNYIIPSCASVVCTSGQYQTTSGSCATCNSNCLTCYGSTSYECSLCISPLLMHNSQCMTSCPQGYSSSNGTCIACPVNCNTCTNSSSCSSCLTGYLMSGSGNCVSSCSNLNTPTVYYINVSDTCQPCNFIDSNCLICTSSNTSIQCTTCINGTYFYNQTCQNGCPIQTYTSLTTNQCINCPINCTNCTSTGCFRCAVGYVVSNMQCVVSCPQGYWVSVASGASICQLCGVNCLTCDGNGSCLTCTQPNSVINGTCGGCVSGYFLSSTLNMCSQCSSSCATCAVTSTQCTSCPTTSILYQSTCLTTCPDGYYNNNGICTLCSTVSCKSCPNDICQICISPYSLSSTATSIACQSNCPATTFKDVGTGICHSCSNNCVSCTSAISCSTCNNVTVLYLGYCLTACPSGQTAVSGVCTQCLTGCKICNPLTTCTACNSGLVNNGNGTCQVNTNSTVNCSAGYYQNTLNNCSQCYPTCQTCSASLVSDCLSCFSGSNLINGVCLLDCNTDQFFNPTTTLCQLCSSIYSNCISCTASGCTSCATPHSLVNGTCGLSCPQGTYMASGQCLSCSTFCVACTSSSVCTQCINGTTPAVFLYGGACSSTCPQLTYQVGSGCLPCDQTCLTCSGSSSNCSSCLSAYNLYIATCVISCPNVTYASNYNCLNCPTNCLLCSSGTNCTSCASTFYLLNGTCRSSCPSGYYVDTTSNRCLLCVSPCTQCTNRTACTACQSGFNLTGTICMGSCTQGYYYNSTFINCSRCPLGNCGTCSATTCFACSTTTYSYHNAGVLALCLTNCLTSFYPDNTTMSCEPCYVNCYSCSNASYCTRCSSTYYLLGLASAGINQCVSICPLGYFQFTDVNNILPNACIACSTNCNECNNQTYCIACQSHYYLYTSQNANSATQMSCVSNCPLGYANPTIISGTGMCSLCGTNCVVCLDAITCTQCISSTYVVINGICTPYNCLNCINCTQAINTCHKCVTGFYRFNSGCTTYCPNGYYANITTGACQLCMANCDICFTSTSCAQCITSYTFVDATLSCQNQGFVLFGAAGNMSGFTSNVTQIMATTYVATSAGPIAFGALTNTYGVMQVCQFMYLMSGSSDGNPEMATFLDSLSVCSFSNTGNTTANTTTDTGNTTTTARRLQVSYTDSFLTTALPIVILMACFLSAYILVLLFQKYGQNCCSSSPCLQKYLNYTCQFMEKRFKWTYVDLIMWISYLPFLYFAILQAKAIKFGDALNIFSSLLAYAILIVYPFYPIFILKKIFDKNDDRRLHLKSYKAITLRLPIDEEEVKNRPLCADVKCCPREDPNASMVEMSLAPWIDKVVRPVYNVDIPEYSEFKYFSIPHWRLGYAAIKYFRKFLFVLTVALIPMPAATLGTLVGISVVYLLYLFILKPKEKLYLILEIILEFLILGFEIFMLIYVTHGGATVSVLSILAHAIGFALANSTLAIAIILNLLAYYTIFCCVIDCIKHLKSSAERDERGEKEPIDDLDEKGDLDVQDGEYQFPEDEVNVDLQKDLIRNFDGDEDPEELVANMDMEKELVRDFGRMKDEYPDVVIPVDLEKQIVRDFGGDQCPTLLVKNNDLEKELVRNFGRQKDGDDYPEPIIPYDLEKKIVRDFGGDDRPEDLVKNNDLEKELVRNFGRVKDGEQYPVNVVDYDLEKQIVRDFGGDQRAEELVKNNDLEKELVRNFGREKIGDQYPENVIEYDLEKQLVRNFGGDERPEELVDNADMEKELVKNFGKSQVYDFPDDVAYREAGLDKDIIKKFEDQDKELGLDREPEPRRRGDDELTEENNMEDIPLDHMDLDEKDFAFNLSPQAKLNDSTFFVDMPQLNIKKVENKPKPKAGDDYYELNSNTEEQMARSVVSNSSSQDLTGMVKQKNNDKFRRDLGANKPSPNKISRQHHEESSEALFTSPNRNRNKHMEEVEDIGTNDRLVSVRPPKNPKKANDFYEFEDLDEGKLKPPTPQKSKAYLKALPNPVNDNLGSNAELNDNKKRTITENKYYKGSDEEDDNLELVKEKSNKNVRKNRKEGASKTNVNKILVEKSKKEDDFEQILYERPESKWSNPGSKKDIGNESSSEFRKSRNSNLLRLNRASGNLKVGEGQEQFQEDKVFRDTRRSKKAKESKLKSGRLNIEGDESDGNEDLEELTF